VVAADPDAKTLRDSGPNLIASASMSLMPLQMLLLMRSLVVAVESTLGGEAGLSWACYMYINLPRITKRSANRRIQDTPISEEDPIKLRYLYIS
jgi:hypothetical protein